MARMNCGIVLNKEMQLLTLGSCLGIERHFIGWLIRCRRSGIHALAIN